MYATHPPAAWHNWIPALILISTLFAILGLLYAWRAREMRALARRFNLVPLKELPRGFYLRGLSAPIRNAWNIQAGKIVYTETVIFDCILGGSKGRGIYATIIACKSPTNPFGEYSSPDHCVRNKNWTAVYRTRTLQVPWTMSIADIEGYILSISNASDREWIDAPGVGRE